MSYKVEITDSTANKLEVSSSINNENTIVEIIETDAVNVNVISNVPLLPSDFNDNVKIIVGDFLEAGYGVSLTPSGSYLLISATGLQPSGDYSLQGHNHNSIDIVDFDSSVSGLLPVKNILSGSGISVVNSGSIFTVAVTGQFGLTSEEVDDRVSSLLAAGYGVNLNYDDNLNTLTISTTGLQPSGNYSLVGHSHAISDVSGLQNILDNKQPSGSYASGVHSHISSDITNFNSGVSGLLPVKNVSGGSGISVSNSGGDFTVAVTGQFGLTSEQVDDRVSNLLVAGNYINLNYNDNADTLTVNVTGLQPSGNYATSIHNHIISDITDFNSGVSGLLPVKNINSGSYTSVTSSSGDFTVSVTGLQPSGNYSVVGHSHIISDVSGLQNALDNKQPSGIYASGVHTHVSSDITDFNSSVSGLLIPYALLNSPAFSGVPTAPTAASGTNNSQIANTQFVRSEISNLVASAPSTLDTLNELATALGNDPNFATTVTNTLAGKANLSGASFSGVVTAPTGNFTALQQNSVPVSVSGHTHVYTDITNFASGVADNLSTTLLPGSFVTLDYNSALDTLIIGTSGLQPSGNYSVVGHAHTASNITDFNSSVSGLLPVKNVVGSGYVNVSSVSGTYTVTATGLQPSGNYSTVGHTHTSSNITDFNSSVSGLLPVKDIVAGTGISVSGASGIYTINSTVDEVARAASLVTTVFNKTASTINKGSVVYIDGGQGDQPTIQLAIAANEGGSSKTYGITAENIGSMSLGRVVVAGALTGINTDQFNPTAPVGDVNGSTLYLSPTVSGTMTRTKPVAPDHMVSVGTIVRTHQNEGVIEVRIQNGFELYELHDVKVSGVTDGQFLQYHSGSGLWFPSSSGNFSSLQVNGAGVSISGHSHISANITDFSSSVSGLLPVKNILAGTNITVTSSSGDYTINTPEEVVEYAATTNFPSSGNISLLYIATDASRSYRWTGNEYVEVGASPSYTIITNIDGGSATTFDLFTIEGGSATTV